MKEETLLHPEKPPTPGRSAGTGEPGRRTRRQSGWRRHRRSAGWGLAQWALEPGLQRPEPERGRGMAV